MPSDYPPPEPVELNDQWATADSLRFELDQHELPRAVITTPGGDATVYMHGAHLTHYQPEGGQPVLWMSRRSRFEAGSPIRGGVPICFPWFGPKADDPQAPSHGTARLAPWEVVGVNDEGEGLDLELGLTIQPFRLMYRVAVTGSLGMSLRVTNRGREPASFEAALHTYLAVADVRRVSIAGLEGVAYLDKTQAGQRQNQGAKPITFTGETDRVYLDTRGACLLDDPGLGRRITVSKQGSDTTVVWNPWTAKAAALEDFDDDQWPAMVCIETANAAANAVTLKPGASHEMTADVSVKPL